MASHAFLTVFLLECGNDGRSYIPDSVDLYIGLDCRGRRCEHTAEGHVREGFDSSLLESDRPHFPGEESSPKAEKDDGRAVFIFDE